MMLVGNAQGLARAPQPEPSGAQAPFLPDPPPAHVVLITGSAGSLKALLQLLPEVDPALDVAVLVSTHMAPDRETYLPQILGRVTRWPVSLAQPGESLLSGHVYVVPPGHHQAVLSAGRVVFVPQPVSVRRGCSLDPLLMSAARDLGARAVGVVLSGANENGAAGLRAIRAAGGLGLAQDPSEAVAKVMPQAALAAGVDFCGAAGELGRYLSARCSRR